MRKLFFATCLLVAQVLCMQAQKSSKPLNISGIYPSLGYFNNEGECGTGAVVPWADRLWVITYGPHMPYGSSDKLYEITPDFKQITRPESIGGTPANRMIHKESNQLFIGPYAIDVNRNVRTIPVSVAPGRHTGIARDIFDPANKVVIGTMEEGFYEVDVKMLNVKTLYKDGNQQAREGISESYESDLLKGVHGKGLYSGQGVMVFSNNGEAGWKAKVDPRIEAGGLSEWDGKDWKLVRRNQFTEVTGPGGIYGNENPSTDPIWVNGWDYKSVILGTRDHGKWTFFRLPKASNSYDGAHGWNTEWPRIRNIGTDDKREYMMTMHGMFWHFPQTFSSVNTAGIRPRSSYLKVIGDFCRWNNQLVFGCDDAAKSEFLNKRKSKGGIEAPGQSQSNLWFTTLNQPDNTGTTDACGSVWQNEKVKAGEVSEPYLFAGWKNRTAWIKNESDNALNFTFETDVLGNNSWTNIRTVSVPAKGSAMIEFPDSEKGEWIRATAEKEATITVSFVYADTKIRNLANESMFAGLAGIGATKTQGGLLYSLGENRRALGILGNSSTAKTTTETGYYEMDANMNIVPKTDEKTAAFIRTKVAIPSQVVTVDAGSYLIVDDSNRRWRLPLGNAAYKNLMEKQAVRICREVATERDLFSCGGTFYELPAENADGFAKIRPIATHNLKINDYVSYRGMVVMTGIDASKIPANPHIFQSVDKKCTVWAGVIDDLWKLGKPVGKGGPWVNTAVEANVPSDAYLFGMYDDRTLTLSQKSAKTVEITVQLDPTGDNVWMNYKTFRVDPDKQVVFKLPTSVQARWIRFVSNENITATAWLEYK
ncbi:MAG: hypothetical protein JZU53_14305 [Paludibacter sp.]|nr:hypothetical protein [Paludibacter sp.]